MKNIISTILLLIPLSLNAQWEIINEGLNGNFNSIDFIDEDIGWIGGWWGTLYKTIDGGESWIKIQPNGNWDFCYFDFINEGVGWAITTGATSSILKTNDGGTNWSIQTSISDWKMHSIYAVDQNVVYITGEAGIIMKTTNGGVVWQNVSPIDPALDFSSVWFKNAQLGLITGSYDDGQTRRAIIRKTSNGGINWIDEIIDEFESIFDLEMLDDSTGYFRSYSDTTNFICKTDNMLETWVIKTTHQFSISSYHFIDGSTGYAIMEDSTTENNIMKSINSGLSWQCIYSSSIRLDKIFLNDQSSGIVFGYVLGTILLRSTDGGLNWKTSKISYPFKDVYFNDLNRGFLIGGACLGRPHCYSIGHLFGIDNGEFYLDPLSGFPEIGVRILFNDELEGYILTSWLPQVAFTEIFKTTDKGNSWLNVYKNNFENFDSIGYRFGGNDICFINNQSGFVVGCYSDTVSGGQGILSTNNTGEDWELIWVDTLGGQLFSICKTSVSCYAVGDGGTILKYTPQSGWAKQNLVTTLPLNKVIFFDQNHGWIAGGYQNNNGFQKILLKTTDGGTNWNTVLSVPYLFRDIEFIDNNLGWAIGYTQSGDGGILKTTDGGNTWEIDKGDLSAKLNALFIKDECGWAVGDNGLILRTTNAGPTWVEDEAQTLPTEFVLGQNYPNPFNPTTKIKYQIPTNSKVVLKVYDLLGREITSLVNEEKPAGDYEVEFNSRMLSSGVYLYQLQAGEFVNSKKMILIK